MQADESKFSSLTEIEKRRIKALELKKSGANYAAIAKALDISVGTAFNDVTTSLNAISGKHESYVDEMRTLSLERIEIAMLAIFQEVKNGSLPAIDRWHKLLDQRNKLLGLYAPIEVKTEVNTTVETVDYSQMNLEELMEVYNKKINEPDRAMKQIVEVKPEQY